jgi:hypothetical protein
MKKNKKQVKDVPSVDHNYRADFLNWLYDRVDKIMKVYNIGKVEFFFSFNDDEDGEKEKTKNDMIFSIKYVNHYKIAYINVYGEAEKLWKRGDRGLLFWGLVHEISHILSEKLAVLALNRFSSEKEINEAIEELTESIAQLGRRLISYEQKKELGNAPKSAKIINRVTLKEKPSSLAGLDKVNRK